jgi:hypothetical protein
MKSRIKWLMPEMQDKAVQKQPKGEGKKDTQTQVRRSKPWHHNE